MLQFMRSSRNPLAQCLLALALLAVGMHAAIPKGYMLDFNERTGGLSVVFCSAGLADETRFLDLETGEIEQAHPADHQTPQDRPGQPGVCAFAAAAAATDTPQIETPMAPVLAVERVHLRETKRALKRGLRPLPPARGPPNSL
ncbi:MAG: hypothetical protein GYB36_03600 [Alphaproteobacteria bacterium]|nr:hypothetical protein [Alphaproteobacteria bacterium]